MPRRAGGNHDVTDQLGGRAGVTGDGDHDRYAHYVDKNESTRAYIEGTPVRALCGKIWVPTRDPSRYPVCPTCQEIVDAVFGKDDDGDEGGEG